MGSKNEFNLRGSKGDSSSKTPTEAADSLRSISYFRILDLVSEGEIGGLVNGLQSVFLDQTPVANADGTLNFQGVHVDLRTGTQDQSYIPGYSSVENEISVSTELKSTAPWTQALNDTDLSAVRLTLGVPSLQQTNTSNGDIQGYSIQFAIDVQTDAGAFQTVLTSAFTGKQSGEYQRSIRVDLPAATTGWTIRIRRLTPNKNSATVADTMTVVSYTEIIDAKLRYPNSAYLAISGDASQFSNIPARAYDLWGRLVQVPSNYNPSTRAYTGVWDGSFQIAWTNNPAWVFYDIVTQNRFGLGDLIDASLVDKWSLYQIAQYCDQLVTDGNGDQEPRFTCNVFLQTQEDAYKLLGDLASIFRGIAFWGGGTITASADMPADPVYTYTGANVVGGKFTYQSTARKTRYTTALVTWNDPGNFYNQATEYYEDPDGLARYGIQQTSFVAFGCTSQGQAQRAAKWTVLSSQLETDSVTFQVGLDGLMCAPGQIINIADAKRAGARQGGRISAATSSSVTVDRAPDQAAVGDSLTVILPTGMAETHTISAIVGKVLSISGSFSQAPVAQSVWAVQSATLALQTYRVTSVVEDKSATAITFTVTAVQHNASKFAAIDNGTAIQVPPISRLPTGLQPPPTNVTITGGVVTTQGIATNVMTISWDAPVGAASYKVEWQKDNGQWIQAGTVSTASIDIQGIYTGQYLARVTAMTVGNTPSVPAYSVLTDVEGKTGAPPSLTFLTATSKIFGIDLAWGFPEGAEDTQRTEIWYSPTPSLADATKLGDYAYPGNSLSMNGLAAGASFFFWGRLVDRTGNIGPWYPTGAGVNGQSSSDATPILDYLNGQITNSQLGQDLLSTIQLVEPDMAGDEGAFAGDTVNFAGTWTLLYAQQSDDLTISKRVDTVAAQMNGFGALVQTETQARIDADGALASQVTNVQASLGATNASVQTNATAIATLNGSVSAAYTIKVQVATGGQLYGAGMAIGVDNSSGITQSQILFQADRFGVINVANGSTTSPFVIVGGQTFINQAFIGTGWITNAMIGGVIQTTAVDVNGNPLWSIDKSGSMIMRGSSTSGRTEIDGNGARTYDNNGTLRVRWGIWT